MQINLSFRLKSEIRIRQRYRVNISKFKVINEKIKIFGTKRDEGSTNKPHQNKNI